MGSALALAGSDVTGAARTLVSVAKKDAAEHLVLNNSTRAAVHESIAAEELAQLRRELVDCLDVAWSAGLCTESLSTVRRFPAPRGKRQLYPATKGLGNCKALQSQAKNSQTAS